MRDTIYLTICENCGKVYRCPNSPRITDGGDILNRCLRCHSKEIKTIQSEDWIVDLIYRTKG